MNKRETKIAQLISSRIKQRDPSAEIILFGSHATGTAANESDWDILILMDRPKKIDLMKKYIATKYLSLSLENLFQH